MRTPSVTDATTVVAISAPPSLIGSGLYLQMIGSRFRCLLCDWRDFRDPILPPAEREPTNYSGPYR